MLVLTRRFGESIMIDDDIKITVVEIRGDRCRIGISSPPNIAVHREEVYAAIKRADAQQQHLTAPVVQEK